MTVIREPTGASKESLARLGWNVYFQQFLRPEREERGETGEIDEREVGRVIAPHGGLFKVATEAGELLASLSGKLRLAADGGEGQRPAVGDWVILDARPNEGTATIRAILPRRTKLSRKSAGRATAEQVLAANVDVAFLVSAMTRDLRPRRLERYLAIAREGGVNPVVVLTKSDLHEDAEAIRESLEAVTGGAKVHAVSNVTGAGLEELDAYFEGDATIVLLGSSGVGKSTLINRFLEQEAQATRDIRVDGKGRHTTTHRELFLRPGGGLVIDTPGMREIGLWDAGDGVGDLFADLEELAARCRFRDCSHSGEPGCALEEARRAGLLDAGRVESFQKLRREAAFMEQQRDQRARAEAKRFEKQLSRAQNAMKKQRRR
ncbi:MAG: ribosome small subunit-dependent GTPase A [Polyangiaceae bacterium]|nr:ribosome small subunit-dependent GTPase A [Polyangiaceae bacterium]